MDVEGRGGRVCDAGQAFTRREGGRCGAGVRLLVLFLVSMTAPAAGSAARLSAPIATAPLAPGQHHLPNPFPPPYPYPHPSTMSDVGPSAAPLTSFARSLQADTRSPALPLARTAAAATV